MRNSVSVNRRRAHVRSLWDVFESGQAPPALCFRTNHSRGLGDRNVAASLITRIPHDGSSSSQPPQNASIARAVHCASPSSKSATHLSAPHQLTHPLSVESRTTPCGAQHWPHSSLLESTLSASVRDVLTTQYGWNSAPRPKPGCLPPPRPGTGMPGRGNGLPMGGRPACIGPLPPRPMKGGRPPKGTGPLPPGIASGGGAAGGRGTGARGLGSACTLPLGVGPSLHSPLEQLANPAWERLQQREHSATHPSTLTQVPGARHRRARGAVIVQGGRDVDRARDNVGAMWVSTRPLHAQLAGKRAAAHRGRLDAKSATTFLLTEFTTRLMSRKALGFAASTVEGSGGGPGRRVCL